MEQWQSSWSHRRLEQKLEPSCRQGRLESLGCRRLEQLALLEDNLLLTSTLESMWQELGSQELQWAWCLRQGSRWEDCLQTQASQRTRSQTQALMETSRSLPWQ